MYMRKIDIDKERQIDLAWEQHTNRRKVRTDLKERLSEQQNHRCCFCGVRFGKEKVKPLLSILCRRLLAVKMKK